MVKFSDSIHAVVAGVSVYGSFGLKDLPAVRPEAQRLASLLRAADRYAVPEGQVSLLVDSDCTREALLGSLASVAAAVSSEAVLLVYFAGHAQNVGEDFVLVTSPAGREALSGVSGRDLEEVLKSTQARGVLVILDCCGGAAIFERTPAFFRLARGGEFRILVSASRAGQSSWEYTEERRSAFTSRLLHVLSQRNPFGSRGAIYFPDLYNDLHTWVLRETRERLGLAHEQEPVFLGAYTREPLILLQRGLTLAGARVRLERLTREEMRRRVTISLTALSLLIAAGIGAYWSWMDEHHYIALDGDSLALMHGVPGHSGFGLPHTEWIYALTRESLNADSALLAGGTVTLPSRAPPERALESLLDEGGRARVAVWRGNRAAARALLIGNAGRPAPPAEGDADLLPLLVQEADLPWLSSQVPNASPTLAAWLVRAIRQVSSESAAQVLDETSPDTIAPYATSLLSSWDGPCGPRLQLWLDRLLTHEGSRFYAPALVQTALRAHCQISLAAALTADPRSVEDLVYGLRLSNPPDTQALKAVLATGIASVARSKTAANPDTLSRLAAFLRYAGAGACPQPLLKDLDSMPADARINLAFAIARDCSGQSLVLVRAQSNEWRLELTGTALTSPLTIATLGVVRDPIGVLGECKTLAEARVSDSDTMLRDLLAALSDPYPRSAVVSLMRRLGIDGTDALKYSVTGQPHLERELILWLGTTNPEAASRALLNAVRSSQDSNLLEVAGILRLAPQVRQELFQGATHYDRIPRVILQVLTGEADQAAALLVDPTPAVRATARSYLLARDDWQQVLALALNRLRYADPLQVEVVELSHGRERMLREMRATPQWAARWRTERMDLLEYSDNGTTLALERARDFATQTKH